jgi:hypothetical protein
VTTACEAFDHNFEARHNADMYHGAAAGLSKLLVLGAAQGNDEVRMVLAALEMVVRGSCKSMMTIFPTLHNLLRFLKKFETKKQHNIHAEVSLLNITRIPNCAVP